MCSHRKKSILGQASAQGLPTTIMARSGLSSPSFSVRGYCYRSARQQFLAFAALGWADVLFQLMPEMIEGLVLVPAMASPSLSFTKKLKTHNKSAVSIQLTEMWNAVVATNP